MQNAFTQHHAVVIGVNAYAAVAPLRTAVADARAIGAKLAQDHGFWVTTMLDAADDALHWSSSPTAGDW